MPRAGENRSGRANVPTRATVHPLQSDLVHDLRNLVGLVRAMAGELPALIDRAPGEAARLARELDEHSRFALEALRLVEHWDDPAPLDASLGAWAWALRLRARDLALGELAVAPRASIVVPASIAAGERVVAAIGRGRAVRVEIDGEAGVVFRAVAAPADGGVLDRALEAFEGTGLRAERLEGSGCNVRVCAAEGR